MTVRRQRDAIGGRAMYEGKIKAASTTRVTTPMIFAVAILSGSFLLFLVQPMVARMALPRLGGAPAVWNSAMLVYQALLLGGYAWGCSHLLAAGSDLALPGTCTATAWACGSASSNAAHRSP